MKVCLIPLMLVTLCGLVRSQDPNPVSSNENRVSLKSWKTGTTNIVERTVTLSFEQDTREYEIDVEDQSKRKLYRLQLRRTYVETIRRPSIDCWSLTLKELVQDSQTGGRFLGPNLLSVEGPGAGDSFAREDWAGYLCPITKPQLIRDGSLYPIKAERNFFIEKFLLTVQVTDYEYDESAIRLTKMDLRLRFSSLGKPTMR